MWISILSFIERDFKMSFIFPQYFWLLLLLFLPLKRVSFKELSFVACGYMLSFVFIVIALARPVVLQEPIKTQQILSDVILGVDLSYSMQAADIKPTRLAFAKAALKEILQSLSHTRFGVLGFSTNAIVLSPLSEDKALLLHLYESLDEQLIMTKGSNIMPSLKLARAMSKSKKLSVVLFTDGADEVDYSDEARFAKENNLVVNILMIATKMGATLSLNNGELLKDELDNIVVTSQNSTVSVIAKSSGGVYTQDVGEIIDALSVQQNKDYKTQTTLVKNRELFYYFIILAIIVFLVSITTLKYKIKNIFGVILVFFGLNLNGAVFDVYYENKAVQAYKSAKFHEAASYYSKISDAKAYFNLANSYYKNGDYEKALQNYEKVKSDDSYFKSLVFYNMANTMVRLKKFKQARENYLKSLTLAYSFEADENYHYIKNVAEEMTMLTGQQKTKKESSAAEQRENSQQKKQAGGSNMQANTDSKSGAGESGKKVQQNESMFDMNQGKAKLSSKQYELINKRQVDEKKPW